MNHCPIYTLNKYGYFEIYPDAFLTGSALRTGQGIPISKVIPYVQGLGLFMSIPLSILRRLLNEELHSLYRSPNIVREIKSRRLRWAGHVARMEEGKGTFKILTDKPTVKRPWGGLGVDGRTILEWTLKR